MPAVLATLAHFDAEDARARACLGRGQGSPDALRGKLAAQRAARPK